MNLCTPYAIPNQIAFSGIMKRMNIKLYGLTFSTSNALWKISLQMKNPATNSNPYYWNLAKQKREDSNDVLSLLNNPSMRQHKYPCPYLEGLSQETDILKENYHIRAHAKSKPGYYPQPQI